MQNLNVQKVFLNIDTKFFHKFQQNKFLFSRLDAAGGERKHVNISNIAEQTHVPVSTLWKRVNDKVRGMGHCSGGPRQPKVLTKDFFCLLSFSLEN